MDRYRIIEVKQSVFADNDAAAERLRGELDAQGTYLINLMSSPGSGKTTTLYMILERLAELPVNIVAIEDPVEKHIRGISQMQVNTQAGLTFETGLRAALRQDPDVIMVGETRDSQTLKTSVRAAVTGHLLSLIHI